MSFVGKEDLSSTINLPQIVRVCLSTWRRRRDYPGAWHSAKANCSRTRVRRPTRPRFANHHYHHHRRELVKTSHCLHLLERHPHLSSK